MEANLDARDPVQEIPLGARTVCVEPGEEEAKLRPGLHLDAWNVKEPPVGIERQVPAEEGAEEAAGDLCVLHARGGLIAAAGRDLTERIEEAETAASLRK